jgi:N-acetyltransferase
MNFSFADDIVLENEHVQLRPLTTEDLPGLLPAACSAENLVRFSPFFIHTPAYLEQFITESISEREKNSRYPFAVYDKLSQQLAGSTSIANVSNKDRRLEIGWTWLGVPFQKTGVNRNAKFLLLQYIFDRLSFERVEFRTDERNVASRTAMEKMGAQFEGALRSHTLMPDGFRRTTLYYSILHPEWQQLKPAFLKRETAL